MKLSIRLLFLLIFCLGLCAFSGTIPPLGGRQIMDLSFEQRVVYQRAMEEVYWAHMIWPEFNPQPKPSLSAAMSDKEIRFKVEEYLRKSNALASYWHHPITAEQLQSEMDRMAKETKDSQTLRELWSALGNDPYLIAESLARPILVDRFTQQINGFDQWWTANRGEVQMLAEIPVHQYRLPQIKSTTFDFTTMPMGLTSNSWTSTTTSNAPSQRCCQTAVWTGTQMIIWGGFNGTSNFNTGSRYTPSTNSWSATSTTGAPSARLLHTAVWTGTQMIIWGGCPGSTYLNDGGRYNPSNNSWTAVSNTGAPSARCFHTAVWTGTRMIVWGGDGPTSYLSTGGRYNPSNNSWAATSNTGAPSRRIAHTAVWTGTEMIIWGGGTDNGWTNKGARYKDSSNSWTSISTTGAPSARDYHTAVWTGTQMIIWGGSYLSTDTKTGGRYTPSSNSWTTTTTTNAPTARDSHTAIWTGTQMIIWGGNNAAYNTFYQSGGRYTPSSNSWASTTTTGAPSGRTAHTAIWTGSQMIVWGGSNANGYLATGGRYTP